MHTLKKFNTIKVFAFDVDGVLTNGSLVLLPNGIMARTMNVKDGYALQLAIKKGYKIVVISGGKSDEVVQRFNYLGITDVFMQVHNKVDVLKNYLQQNNIQPSDVLFMGDDIPDAQVMQYVGLPCCPADAVPEILAISTYISPITGGNGCARDVIEKVLKLHNNWDFSSFITSK